MSKNQVIILTMTTKVQDRYNINMKETNKQTDWEL